MIVTCPACQVNYRMPSHAKSARNGKCSRCETLFPVATRSAYRLLSAAVGRADLLSVAAVAGGDVPDMPSVTRPVSANPQSRSVAAREQTSPKPVPKASRWLVNSIAVLVMAAAGAASGFYLSVIQKADGVIWMSAGGAIGLAIAGVVILWNRPKR